MGNAHRGISGSEVIGIERAEDRVAPPAERIESARSPLFRRKIFASAGNQYLSARLYLHRQCGERVCGCGFLSARQDTAGERLEWLRRIQLFQALMEFGSVGRDKHSEPLE